MKVNPILEDCPAGSPHLHVEETTWLIDFFEARDWWLGGRARDNAGWQDCPCVGGVALSYGADDLHGTIIYEHTFHNAGTIPRRNSALASKRRSRCCSTSSRGGESLPETRRMPVQQNTFCEPIKILKSLQTATIEAEPPSGKSKMLKDNMATT